MSINKVRLIIALSVLKRNKKNLKKASRYLIHSKDSWAMLYSKFMKVKLKISAEIQITKEYILRHHE